MKFRTSGRKLRVDNTTIELRDEIGDAIEVGDKLIVRLRTLGRESYSGNTNIWAFDKDGTKLWEIEEEPPAGSDAENPFVAVWNEGTELWVQCWGNHEHRVDLNSGELIEKRPYR